METTHISSAAIDKSTLPKAKAASSLQPILADASSVAGGLDFMAALQLAGVALNGASPDAGSHGAVKPSPMAVGHASLDSKGQARVADHALSTIGTAGAKGAQPLESMSKADTQAIARTITSAHEGDTRLKNPMHLGGTHSPGPADMTQGMHTVTQGTGRGGQTSDATLPWTMDSGLRNVRTVPVDQKPDITPLMTLTSGPQMVTGAGVRSGKKIPVQELVKSPWASTPASVTTLGTSGMSTAAVLNRRSMPLVTDATATTHRNEFVSQLSSTIPAGGIRSAKGSNLSSLVNGMSGEKKPKAAHSETIGTQNPVYPGIGVHGFAGARGNSPVSGEKAQISVEDPNVATKFGDIIVDHAKFGDGKLEVQVQPQGMGKIVITVNQQPDGVRLLIQTDNAQTQQWLTQEAPRVSDAIRSAGLDVSGLQVRLGLPDTNSGSDHQQPSGQRQKRANSSANRLTSVNESTPSSGSSYLDVGDLRARSLSLRI